MRTNVFAVRLFALFAPNIANSEQDFFSEITNSANSSPWAISANESERRTVHFFEIVEHGEQCEQVRTLPCGIEMIS